MKQLELGTIKSSPEAIDALEEHHLSLESLLARHQNGDRGTISDMRSLWNEHVTDGLVVSKYNLSEGTILLIITSIVQSCTRVMLENEYQTKEVNTQEGYSLWAPLYDRENNPLISVEEPHVFPILDKLEAKTVLDVGTGTGRFAIPLAQRGMNVFGIDLSSDMLKFAKQNAQHEGVKIEFQRGSLFAIPYKPNYFDLVICGLVLCHIADITGAIDELSRVTKDGGHLIITDFHPGSAEIGGRTVFSLAEGSYMLPNERHSKDDYLGAAKKAGFKIINVIDLCLGDMPEENIPFYKSWIQKDGDQLFSLIIHAQKRIL